MIPGRVYLVGAGPGDPGLITVRGLDLLRRADVVIYDRLVNPALLDEARPDAVLVFAGKATGAHCLPQSAINALLIAHARCGRQVVRLKGGDPFVFGRGGEEAMALARAGLSFEVVPGVSSAVAVPAYAGIPLTYRGLASSFTVIAGHEDPSKGQSSVDLERLARTADTLVILMGTKALPRIARDLVRHGRGPATPVALIHSGTTAAQDTAVTTLGELAVAAIGHPIHELTSPALAVIGEVVGLGGSLTWFKPSQALARGELAPAGEPAAGGRAALSRASRVRTAIGPVREPGQELALVAPGARSWAPTRPMTLAARCSDTSAN
jgi:uroporphyrin-III C-methyltransferase